MKVDRVYDKATGKTHVTVTTLISNQGPTVSEYDELPDIPMESIPTISAIRALGNQVNNAGLFISNNLSKMVNLQEHHEVSNAIINGKDTPVIMEGITSNDMITQITLQASNVLKDSDIVIINDATNGVILKRIEASQFIEGLKYNGQNLSIEIPLNCESITISANTDIMIFASILYLKR